MVSKIAAKRSGSGSGGDWDRFKVAGQGRAQIEDQVACSMTTHVWPIGRGSVSSLGGAGKSDAKTTEAEQRAWLTASRPRASDRAQDQP